MQKYCLHNEWIADFSRRLEPGFSFFLNTRFYMKIGPLLAILIFERSRLSDHRPRPAPMTTDASGAAAAAAELFLTSAAGGKNLSAITVSGDEGVDLAAVGRALGLDPRSVRLNGHLISRGSDHRSSVTWPVLVGFFSSRGFPAGTTQLDPIVVQGKPAIPSDNHRDLDMKRKCTLEDEHQHKKRRCSKSKQNLREVQDRCLSDYDILSISKRLKLDDSQLF